MKPWLPLALAPLLGCGPGSACAGESCDCEPARQLSDGTCCLGFTHPRQGRCSARVWTTPAAGEAWGEPGAVDLDVVVDSDGRGVASWVATAGGQLTRAVTLAEETDGGWVTHAPGAALPGFGTRAALAAGPGGEILAGWKQQLPDPADATAPNDVSYLSRRTGGAWEHPASSDALSLPPSGHEPRPLIAPWGEAFVLWNQWSDLGYGVALARRSGDDPDGALGRPSDPTDVLSPPINFSNTPQIAVGANGDALIVWYQSPAPRADLMVFASERYRVDGTFSRPGANAFISPTGAPVDAHRLRNPVPSVGAKGHAAVVWSQENGEGDTPIFIATRDGLRTWTVPLGLWDTFSPARGKASCAQVAFGTGTELFVTWFQDLGAGNQAWAAHREGSGVWDVAGSDPFALSSPGAEALDPWLVTGADGEALVAWAERADGPWRIAARRRNAGATTWSELDVLSADDGTDAVQPVAAIGGAGRALVAWRQGPAGQETVRFAAMD